jgi:hypothetical protein
MRLKVRRIELRCKYFSKGKHKGEHVIFGLQQTENPTNICWARLYLDEMRISGVGGGSSSGSPRFNDN